MKGDLAGQLSQFQPRGMLGMCEDQCLNEAQLLIGCSFFSLWTVKKKWVSGARGGGASAGVAVDGARDATRNVVYCVSE